MDINSISEGQEDEVSPEHESISSSRPKRKLKPRNFSDDFITFGKYGNHSANSTFTPDDKARDANFVTSTPMKKPVRHVKAKSNEVPVNSLQSANKTNDSIDNEVQSELLHQNETSQFEALSSEYDIQNNSKEISFASISENDDSCGTGVKKKVISRNEILCVVNKNLERDKRKNNIVKASLSQEQSPEGVQYKNKASSVLEESKVADYREEAKMACDEKLLKSNRRKRKKNDDTSLPEKGEVVCDNEDEKNKNDKDINKNNQKKSLAKISKKRKNISSVEDNNCQESVGSDAKKIEPFENHIKSRHLLDDGHSKCVNSMEVVFTGELELTTSGLMKDRTSPSITDIPIGPKKRSRGRPPKTNLSSVTNTKVASLCNSSVAANLPEEQIGDEAETNVTPVSQRLSRSGSPNTSIGPQKKSRGRPRRNVSQETEVRKVDEMDAVFEVIQGENSSESNASLEIHMMGEPGSDKGASSHTALQRKHSGLEGNEKQICSPPDNGASSQRSQRKRPKIVPNEKQMYSPPEAFNPVSQDILSESAAEASPLINENETKDTSEMKAPQKRGRGRPPKYFQPREKMLSRATQNEPPSQVPEDLQSEGSELMCRLCRKQMKTLSALKLHMMLDHSLTWSREFPAGFENAYVIVKKIGHIDCQKCSKRFKNAQYYKHHQIWCGREEELATCEVCSRTVKAMWLQQHLTAHKTQTKKQAMEAEQSERDKEEDKMKDDIVEDGESQSDNRKSKRKAAKNAIKLMTSLQEDTVEHNDDSSSNSYTEESSEESSDEEEDEEEEEDGEEEEEDEGKEGVRKTPKKLKPSNGKGSKHHRSRYDDSSLKNIWLNLCRISTDLGQKEKTKLLHKFYAHQTTRRSFPDISPKHDGWRPLAVSEKQKYIPVSVESLKFILDSTKDKKESEEHSLKFGQTLSHNGKSYCYTGGPIWAVEWCPIPKEASHVEILAVSADRSTGESEDTATLIAGSGLIQIWSVGSLKNEIKSVAEPILQYAIAHDSGYVRSMSWCPMGCFDVNAADGYLRRLGLLAVACSDGAVLIYCPPQPEELKQGDKSGGRSLIMFRPQPALVLTPNSRKGCGPCLSVSWQQGGDFKYVVAGYGQGTAYLWDISTSSPLLKVDSSTLRPLRCFTFHSMAIVSCCWNPSNPSVFVTAAFDFNVCLWSIERPDQPLGIIRRQQFHQSPRSVCWAGPLYNGIFTTCDKYTGFDQLPVCFHGLAKAGIVGKLSAIVLQWHTACIWDITFSPIREVLVTCDAIGRVKVMSLPMKIIRFSGAGKSGYHQSKVLSADLYHAKLSTRIMSSSSQPIQFISSHSLKQESAGSFLQAPSNEMPNTNVVPNRQVEEQVKELNKDAVTKQTSDSTETDINLPKNKSLSACETSTEIKTVDKNRSSTSESNKIASDTSSVVAAIPTNNYLEAGLHLNGITGKDSNHEKVTSQVVSASDKNFQNLQNNFSRPSVSCDGSSTLADSSMIPGDSLMPCMDPCLESVSESVNAVLETSKTGRCVGVHEDITTNQSGSRLDSEWTQEVSEDYICFHNCKMKKEELKKPPKQKSTGKPELENFGGNNSQAIYRVRLNPNPECCLWLASGGQSGILRLDNLSGLVHP